MFCETKELINLTPQSSGMYKAPIISKSLEPPARDAGVVDGVARVAMTKVILHGAQNRAAVGE